ncbi:hypothetical protein BH11PSE8_BH11PSE8_03880 [soil metagenome]
MRFSPFDKPPPKRVSARRMVCRIGLATVGCAVITSATAMDSTSGKLAAQAADLADAPQVTLIEMERTPGHVPPSLANAPPGSRAETSGVSYRWWKHMGPSSAGLDVGVGLGTVGYLVRPPVQGAADTVASLNNPSTVLSVGMRYRTSERSVVFADTSSARGFAGNGRDAYVAKVGVEWKSASSPVRLMQGGLGLQLDGGSRMTLRVRRGTVGVYMRSSF